MAGLLAERGGRGGTSLTVSSSGARLAETAWSSTGGGFSRYEAEPSYQRSVQSTGVRTTPDLAAVANPNTGVIIVTGGKQVQVGGTSLSSPIWGGLIAIADQGLATTGKGSLAGATQILPKLYAAPSGSFNDVTSGAVGRSGAGYDTATGLGTPNARTLVPYLAGTTATSAVATTTRTTTSTGGTTSSNTTTTVGTTPVTPPKPPQRWQPPSWWSSRAGIGGYGWGGYFARSVGQTSTVPDRPFGF